MTTATQDTAKQFIRNTKVWGTVAIGLVAILALSSEHYRYTVFSSSPKTIAFLEDPGGRMDIARAADEAIASRYTVKEDNRLSLGFSRSALWIRLDLSQAPKGWVLQVCAPWMDRIDLYTPGAEGTWHRVSTGLQQPSLQPDVTGFALKPPLPPPDQGVAYVRLSSVLALNAGLHLWPETQFLRHCQTRAYLYGGLFGIMTALLVVNGLVCLTLRDKTYFAYTLYLFGIILHQACLQGQVLFLPRAAWPHVPMISLAISAFVFFFGALFCRWFLNTAAHAPAMDLGLMGGQGAALGLLALALSGNIWAGTWVTHLLAVFGPIFAIAAGVQALMRKYSPAGIYLLAWTVMLLSTMAWGAWSLGWLDRFRPPQITLLAAAALESCLLTLALAERVRRVYMDRRRLAQREQQYLRLSITDELTQLYNHRYFWDQLAGEIDRAFTAGYPLSLVVMDLDDFKAINDTYGHDVGDRILNRVGCLLRSNLRPDDTAFRYGGEEFTLILPGADGKAAVEIAERVRTALAAQIFDVESTPGLRITASFGATRLTPGDSTNTLFKRADKQMYRAKTGGKNQVVCEKIAG